ncbi:hypothetical protein, partial [Cloacibacillus evryensis]|uniref:hypothetical protein n=1 Tax=Cloacibacillus evryensis TaxID=508460 RepID=UPI002108C32C
LPARPTISYSPVEIIVGEPGHDADDFDAGLFFGERHRVLEEREVAAEFVEDDPLDAAAVAARP